MDNCKRRALLVDERLKALLSADSEAPPGLGAVMSYLAQTPGKRLRPLLVYAFCEAAGGEADMALDPACAIEMIHIASLMLDDLPAMDNASLRRGKPAAHLVYGEAATLLAIVSLVSTAFGAIANAPGLPLSIRNALQAHLSLTIGASGLCGGQYLDIARQLAAPHDIDRVARLKTGALTAAACYFGAVIGGDLPECVDTAERLGFDLGSAFQLRDDLADRLSTRLAEGKPVQRDEAAANAATVLGLESAATALRRDVDGILARLQDHGLSAESLEWLKSIFAVPFLASP